MHVAVETNGWILLLQDGKLLPEIYQHMLQRT